MLFKTLAGYLAGNDAVGLSITDSQGGKVRVIVTPKPRLSTDAAGALATPLVLTGTADELDQEFSALVAGHIAAQRSLAEQLEATTAVLAAAKKAAGSKAAKAVSSVKPTAGTSSGNDGNDDDNGEGSAGCGCTQPASAAAASVAPVTADDLFKF